jgi:7-cyano-7-deazaguanine synthase
VSDSVAIVSGGLDSTILVYDMIDRGYTPHMLSFNYGQRHNKELRFAEYTAKKLGLKHDIVDLTGITHLISNSALTSRSTVEDLHKLAEFSTSFDELDEETKKRIESQRAIEVPEGHYAEDTMKATVVPNRNMMMLSIAAAIAVNNKYRCIATGVHGGDHFIYPDCRPEFIGFVDDAIITGTEGFHNFETNEAENIQSIFAPFITKTKADIAHRGIELKVPFEETWSCYKGGDKHCGRCGTCVERLEAIDAAERDLNRVGYDKTEYEDDMYWIEATRVSDR